MEKNENIVIHEGVKVSDKKRTLMFININISCIATQMLATALTTALPPIMKDFKIDVSTGQWITSGYSLFLAIVMPLTAFLITKYRTKRLYCVSISIFIVGLAICALSPNFWVMMIGRIIQGFGSGLITSLTQVVILTIYPPEKRGTAMGWYGLSIGVSPVIAPTLAGILVDTIGWRMIFVVSIIIMLISLIVALFFFEDVLPIMNKNFDVISLIMSAFSFGGITLAVGNMGKYKFVSVHVLLFLLIGIIFTYLFVMRQLQSKVPFLDVRVLKDLKLSISIITTTILQLMIIGSAIILPIYIQQLKNHSTTLSGLAILPGSLSMAIFCPISGKIYDKIGMKFLFLIGSITLIFRNFSSYFVNINVSIWVIAFIHIFRCFGIGILLMPVVTWGMTDVPSYKASDATALLNSIRTIGGAIGSALFISIMTAVAKLVQNKKPNPEMYGFNVVFLSMTGFSIILFISGVYGCKGNSKKQEQLSDKKIQEKNSLEEGNANNKSPLKEDNYEIDITFKILSDKD